MTKKLVRIPGNPKTSNIALATLWSKSRFDPNDYYKLLGLEVNHPWLMSDIKTAYRKKMFELHPDSGNTDLLHLDLMQTAYSVIGNPVTRRKYDELGPLDIWMDKNVVSGLMKDTKIKNAFIDEQSKRKKNKVEQFAATDEPEEIDYKLHSNYPVMYHFEDEVLPDIDTCLEWIDLIATCFWNQGYKDEIIRVGFAIFPQVLRESWGSVIMVSGKPNIGQATWLILALKNSANE